jgi:chemotaxis methyl-accepting protein methylase
MELRAFLESLGFNWRGYRKKQRGVRSRLYARVAALDLVELSVYREVVLADEHERRTLHAILGISVTRLFRDRQDWELLRRVVLEPWLTSPTPIVRRAWSMGCASGEEPYTLHMVWRDLIDRGGRTGDLEILATEIRPDLIERARRAVFPSSALRHIPEDLARRYVRVREDGDVELSPQVTSGVEIQRHDYLLDPWPESFDLILARNGIFTYRNREDQDRFLERLASALRPDGHLFVGSHDIVPDTITKRFDRVGRTLWRLRGDARCGGEGSR